MMEFRKEDDNGDNFLGSLQILGLLMREGATRGLEVFILADNIKSGTMWFLVVEV